VTHLKFAKEHHRQINRVAFVTDSPAASIAEKVASHFVNAKIRNFHFDEFEASKKWVPGYEI